MIKTVTRDLVAVMRLLETFTDAELSILFGQIAKDRPSLNLQGEFVDAYHRPEAVRTFDVPDYRGNIIPGWNE